MSTKLELDEFLSAFLAEAGEQLALAQDRLLAVERASRAGEAHPRAVRDLFRALHTLKGLSAMVGIDPIEAIAHAMEAVLRGADARGGKLPAASLDSMFTGLKEIEERTQALEHGRPVAAAPAGLIEALSTVDTEPAETRTSTLPVALEDAILSKLAPFERELLVKVPDGKRAIRLDFAPSPERAAQGYTINSVRERISAHGDLVKVVPRAVPQGPLAPAGLVFAILMVTDASDVDLGSAAGLPADAVRPLAPAPQHPRTSLAPAELSSLGEAPDVTGRRNVLRVDVERVDAAMDKLGALLVTRSRLNAALGRLTSQGVDTRELQQVAGEHARQLRDLRGAILQVRMVPVSEVLERVPLLVRSLQRATQKRVRLEIAAEGAELDKSVAERLLPVIIHLVRNAVDHGLELGDDRVRAGKPPEGLVRIASAEHSNTRLELTIADDGRGIDRDAVGRRLGHAAPADDADLLAILCQPEFSTKDTATATSGRGMGMDIVRRVVVDDLGGELSMRSQAGIGTSFVLRVPLTIAIVDAFIAECAGQRFVIPVAATEEILELAPEDITRVPSAVRSVVGLTQRRGRALPVVDLATALGAVPSGSARKALVIRRGVESFAFLIDRVLGQQEAVMRPLVDPLVRVPGIAGASDLGDGRATLVLDLPGLLSTLDAGLSRSLPGGNVRALPGGPSALPSARAPREMGSR